MAALLVWNTFLRVVYNSGTEKEERALSLMITCCTRDNRDEPRTASSSSYSMELSYTKQPPRRDNHNNNDEHIESVVYGSIEECFTW